MGIWIERAGRDLAEHRRSRPTGRGRLLLAHGRKKELIIRGGHNIDPKLIEDALQSHPAVALTAAIGSPDAHAGELPVAYVQLKAGAVVTEAELLEHAARSIPEKAAIPKRVKISPSLPTTAVGKLFKPALVEREIEETIRAEAEKAGVAIASVKIERDPQRGLRAVVVTYADGARAQDGPRSICVRIGGDGGARPFADGPQGSQSDVRPRRGGALGGRFARSRSGGAHGRGFKNSALGAPTRETEKP